MKRVYIDKRTAGLLLVLAVAPWVWAQKPQTVTLLQTSDMHSRVEPINKHSASSFAGMGGLVRRATLVKELRKELPELLLFDCGDFSQGTPYYNLFRGEVEVKAMNQMGYDVATIGNHEFDFGLDNLARLFQLADFSIVCANYGFEGTVLAGLVKPYVVIERKGVKIGVFGLSPQLEGLVQADKCAGVTFKDPVAAANETAALLRQKERCDLVICLSHLGYQADRQLLIPQTEQIDLVLGGHSHTVMLEAELVPNRTGQSVSLQHSGKDGAFVNRTDIVIK